MNAYMENKEATSTYVTFFIREAFPWISSVVDFGCGPGAYLLGFKRTGIHDLLGIDLAPEHSPFTEIQHCIRLADLSKPFDAGRTFDLVVSLEVIEHLKPEATDTFIDTLMKHGSLILFSGAPPSQEDADHKNMRWPSEWILEFKKHGYYLLIDPTLNIRAKLPFGVDWWIPRNLMILQKGE